MQKYQQRLLVFVLFITTTYADTKIQSFGPLSVVKKTGDLSSVYPTHIEVGAKVTECSKSTSTCECSVKTTGIDDDPVPLTFTAESEDLGSAQISNLRPLTKYTFTLTCSFSATETETKTETIITDYDRPLPPKNVAASLVFKKIIITWQHETTSSIPINFYKIIFDGKHTTNLTNDRTSFEIPNDYEYNTKHTINVQACNINNQKHAVCSRLEGNEEKFQQTAPTDAPTTTIAATAGPTPTEMTSPPASATSAATTTSTPTSTKSIGVHSYTISIPIIIFSLFFFLLK
ncbi:unnamed protein product [Adineta steineri]|uniref:Fibronectin type-III domain-containing protein n=1 Tax=Adineta steineri TaxID=433720 RepID=A0A814BFN0_9BILA|nr:unnamed protein product [Adineta steineri]CAF0928903.1 unnamed protein product [Adineta steineri]